MSGEEKIDIVAMNSRICSHNLPHFINLFSRFIHFFLILVQFWPHRSY